MSQLDSIKNNFLLFCRNMEPDFSFADVHKFVCKRVQSATIDTPDGRLLLSVPPGFGKSTLCSRMLPAFILGNNPKAKILLLTYGSALSNEHGKGCRRYMQTPQYKMIFPDVQIKGDGESGSFDTEQGGSLKCVGRGGSITGFRANFIIIDDCIKNQQEAQSDRVINGLHDWFSTTAYTRLLPGGGIVAFNTRWTERDIIGYILDNYKTPQGKPWTYINLPAIADSDDDPLGRIIGEALWPEFYPLNSLLEIKAATPRTFGALYQGNPVSEAAVPIKNHAVSSSLTFINNHKHLITSWDTASTQGAGDYTVATTWAVSADGNNATLIDVVRDRVDFTNLLILFDEVDSRLLPAVHIIEDASSGRQLLQLNQERCLRSTCIKESNKFALAESFNTSLIVGKIKILDGVLSQADIKEMCEFPFGKHDDLVLSILHFYKNFLSQDLTTLHRHTTCITTLKNLTKKVSQLSKPTHRIRRLGGRFVK